MAPPPAATAAGLVMLKLEGVIEALQLVELSGFFPEEGEGGREREGKRLIKRNNAIDKEYHKSCYETC